MFNLSEKNVIYQASPLTFDPSVVEIFCTLYSKSTLLVLPQSFKTMSERLSKMLLQHEVDVLQVSI